MNNAAVNIDVQVLQEYYFISPGHIFSGIVGLYVLSTMFNLLQQLDFSKLVAFI